MRSLPFSFLMVAVLLTGCVHRPVSARAKYALAPRLANPLLGVPQVGLPGLTNERQAFVFSGFDGRQLCFDAANEDSPVDTLATPYSLRFLNTNDANLKTAAALRQPAVEVLHSESMLVPVTRTVEDTVRDSHGNTIGTISRQVRELAPIYRTKFRLCFGGLERALTPQARFMVLLREEVGGGWMRPARPSWVWRFPAADQRDGASAATETESAPVAPSGPAAPASL